MNSFVYDIPTKVYFGSDQLGHLGDERLSSSTSWGIWATSSNASATGYCSPTAAALSKRRGFTTA